MQMAKTAAAVERHNRAGLLYISVLTDGPWGIAMLRPQALFGLDLPPLAHGVFWSLVFNILAYIGFSLWRAPTPIERMQADIFVPTGLAPAPSFRFWRWWGWCWGSGCCFA